MTPHEWIRHRLSYADPHNRCTEWTRELVRRFPDLTRVRGHVVWPSGGKTEHWWCTDKDGNIIDPTVTQFDGRGAFRYLPLPPDAIEPVGRCINCGGYIWPPRSAAASSCSDECDRDLDIEYNRR